MSRLFAAFPRRMSLWGPRMQHRTQTSQLSRGRQLNTRSQTRISSTSTFFSQYPLSLFLPFATTFGIALILWTNTFQLMTVTGPSMYPFLNTDYDRSTKRDWVLVDMRKTQYLSKAAISSLFSRQPTSSRRPLAGGIPVRRGDVITFWSPTAPDKMQVKRVVGIAGDLVMPKHDQARDRARIMPNAAHTSDGSGNMQTIPAGHLWVEGDHPESSKNYDSNWYGPISQSLVVGRVVAVVWPWTRRGWIGPRAAEDVGGKIIFR